MDYIIKALSCETTRVETKDAEEMEKTIKEGEFSGVDFGWIDTKGREGQVAQSSHISSSINSPQKCFKAMKVS